jgi:uncharacterized protein (TIRG00374 family)
VLSAQRILRYILSAAIIGSLIFFASRVNWAQAWDSIQSASPLLLLLACLANISSLVFRGIRWWILLRAMGSPSIWLALRATIAGSGLNNVLPASGGEAAKVVFITRTTGLPTSEVIASVALDRLFDPVGFVALLVYGVIAFPIPAQIERLRWPAVGVLLLMIALIVWLTIRKPDEIQDRPEKQYLTPPGWWTKFRDWMTGFVRSMRELANGPRIIGMVLLTLLAWVGQLATFVLAAEALQVHLSIPANLAALLAVNLSLVVRATPGNVGFFQFAYALTLKAFGVLNETAIAVSLLIQTLQIIPITILGVALAPEFFFRRKKAPTPA